MRTKLSNCSGCKACENICPVGCLKIDTSDKYHFIREIDEEKCIKCNLCLQVCSFKRGVLHKPMQGVVAWNKKRYLARDSASGGIATTVYHYCLKNNIACVGVYFNNNQQLMYNFIENEADIKKAAGSKYVYSDMNSMHKEIERRLHKGEKVVFIGLPCHVSGLQNYCKLKKISVENLYTIDIVCHGVPMPIFFKEHLRKICGKEFSPSEIYFRKKDNPFGMTVKKDNQIIYKESRYKDEYMIAYQKGYYAQSCYNCHYATDKRCADISIKDFSHIDKVQLKGRPCYDASAVLINTEKGGYLWEWLKNENLYMQDVDIEKIVETEPMLQHPTPRPMHYKCFCKLERINFRFAIKSIYGFEMFKECISKKLRGR